MDKINSKEAIFIIITICINIGILVAGQVIVICCGSSSLINTCTISILALIITTIICILYKKFIGLSILDIAYYLGGNFLRFIVGIIFFIYFLFTIVVLLGKLVNCLQIVYYPMTNTIYTVLLFVIATGIICNLKNNAFSKANFIVLPISLITLILIFAGNTKNFDYQNIFPILGNGIDSTFISGLSNIFAFGGIAYLYFLPSKLKNPDKFFKISICAVILSAIFLLITVAIIVLMFNPELVNGQLFPLYLAVRYIEFGTFFQRLDSAFLLIRIISFLSFMGIITNLCLNIFKDITKIEDTKPIIYPLMLLVFGFTILFTTYYKLEVLQNLVYKILFFGIVVGVGIIILILANLKRNFQKNKKGTLWVKGFLNLLL